MEKYFYFQIGKKKKTYNIFVAKASKLHQFLAHQEFGFADCSQYAIPDIFWNRFISKIFFKITDLFFKFEDFILQDLQKKNI